MKIFNIVEILPSQQKSINIELILAICSCLKDRGFQVTYNKEINPNYTNLIFGFHKLFYKPNDQRIILNDNCFIFNLAPLSAPIYWMDAYTKALANLRVIDYSLKNLSILKRLNPKINSHHFKFGYFKISPFNSFKKNENNVFYGMLTEHRKSYLDQILSLNIPLKVLADDWGYQRDMQIAMAQHVLNIEKFPGSVLEVYRIWHSLCLGTSVISTRGSDSEMAQHYEPYVSFFDSPAELLSIEKKDPVIFKNETSLDLSIENLIKFM